MATKAVKKPAKTAKRAAKAPAKGRARAKKQAQSVATSVDTPIPFTVVVPSGDMVPPDTANTTAAQATATAEQAPVATTTEEKRGRGRPKTGKPRTVSIRVSDAHFAILAEHGEPNKVARLWLEGALEARRVIATVDRVGG